MRGGRINANSATTAACTCGHSGVAKRNMLFVSFCSVYTTTTTSTMLMIIMVMGDVPRDVEWLRFVAHFACMRMCMLFVRATLSPQRCVIKFHTHTHNYYAFFKHFSRNTASHSVLWATRALCVQSFRALLLLLRWLATPASDSDFQKDTREHTSAFALNTRERYCSGTSTHKSDRLIGAR